MFGDSAGEAEGDGVGVVVTVTWVGRVEVLVWWLGEGDVEVTAGEEVLRGGAWELEMEMEMEVGLVLGTAQADVQTATPPQVRTVGQQAPMEA